MPLEDIPQTTTCYSLSNSQQISHAYFLGNGVMASVWRLLTRQAQCLGNDSSHQQNKCVSHRAARQPISRRARPTAVMV
ncbi:hypothetical protein E2C01_018884 [Portunus trituberculatus]|uniref:Uncharacterized protein n=1 Tax=Portunus trituberculatus TaxID=210409 RepID=A0A5B7DVU9_PORTR|nr:hypothetical protein [Portunus trituberculatus]